PRPAPAAPARAVRGRRAAPRPRPAARVRRSRTAPAPRRGRRSGRAATPARCRAGAGSGRWGTSRTTPPTGRVVPAAPPSRTIRCAAPTAGRSRTRTPARRAPTPSARPRRTPARWGGTAPRGGSGGALLRPAFVLVGQVELRDGLLVDAA